MQPSTPIAITSPTTIRPVHMPVLPDKPLRLVASATFQAQYQQPAETLDPRGMQMQAITSTQLILPATIRPVHKHPQSGHKGTI